MLSQCFTFRWPLGRTHGKFTGQAVQLDMTPLCDEDVNPVFLSEEVKADTVVYQFNSAIVAGCAYLMAVSLERIKHEWLAGGHNNDCHLWLRNIGRPQQRFSKAGQFWQILWAGWQPMMLWLTFKQPIIYVHKYTILCICTCNIYSLIIRQISLQDLWHCRHLCRIKCDFLLSELLDLFISYLITNSDFIICQNVTLLLKLWMKVWVLVAPSDLLGPMVGRAWNVVL